jgi:N-formylglutamate amidohydrolase
MSAVYTYHEGTAPLLVSVPHDGRRVPATMHARMTEKGRALPDTDWHVARLYDFVRELGAHLLVADYSRYVVDLNRPATDESLYPGQVATGLCPLKTFSGDDIYATGGVTDDELAERIEGYWQPYHDCIRQTLDAIRARHGYAVIWDAHSIASRVPRLFDGELPELNVGTYGGRSCAPAIEAAVSEIASNSPYSAVLNGRFQGGFITRHYGDVGNRVHAVQLEISQRAYMDEVSHDYDTEKALRLRDTLRPMLETCIELAGRG